MSASPRLDAPPPFDPADPALIRDPYPFYAAMRASPGLHRAAGGYWVASRHADVREVLTSAAFGQGDFVRNIQLFYGPDFDPLQHASYRWLSEVFLMQDPPGHTRLRKLVSSALTPKRIAAMQPRIEAITAKLLDAVEPRGHMEVLWDFAYQLPTLVMCDMLGLEETERTPQTLARLTRAVADSFIVFETRVLTDAELALADEQIDFLQDYFGHLYDRRRASPQDDLTSALATAREDGGTQLSRAELVNVVVAMFGAGFETTAHMIGNGLLSLHRHPAQWRLLTGNTEEFAARTVEEALRYESSLQATYRTALQPATVAGTSVQPGDKVLCILGSANRDAGVFERPDDFDVTRRDSRVMSFGGGIHHCIGQQLARLEGRVAFAAMAARMPQMTIDTRTPQWRPGFLFRGLTQLTATW